MLKRFMTWLLHWLQKVLSALSGRSSSRSPVASEQNTNHFPTTRPTVPLSLDNFVPPDPSTLPNPSDSAFAVGSEPNDAHQLLDPAPMMLAVPLVPHNMPVETAEVSSEMPLLLLTGDYSVEIQDASQLPEIHDLLPAIEPDEPEELPLDADLLLQGNEIAADSFSEQAEIPEQAVLFSFDITESETLSQPSQEIVSKSVASQQEVTYQAILTPMELPSGSALSVADPFLAPAAVPIADIISDEAQTGIGQPEEKSTDNELKLPAHISIVIEETVVPDASSPVDESSVDSRPALEQSLKSGVVKLLFTTKSGNFHGYIAPDDGSKDILFHQKYIDADIFENLERGTKVMVSAKNMEGKAYATRVDLQEGEDGKQAIPLA